MKSFKLDIRDIKLLNGWAADTSKTDSEKIQRIIEYTKDKIHEYYEWIEYAKQITTQS